MNLQTSITRVYGLFREKRFPEAEATLRSLLEVFPRESRVLALLSQTMVRLKRFAEAIDFADQALAVEQNGEALAAKGQALIASGNIDEGCELLELSLVAKDNSFIRAALVQAYLKKKRSEQARRHLISLLTAEPDNSYYRRLQEKLLDSEGKSTQVKRSAVPPPPPGDRFNYAQYVRQQIKSKALSEALRDLNMMLRLPDHAGNPHLLELLGEVLSRNNMLAEAEEAFLQARGIEPDNVFIRNQLGFLYNKMNRHDRVIDLLAPSFLEKPADQILRSVLIKAYQTLGQIDELERLLAQAIVRHPQVKQLYGILKKIQRSRESE